MVQPPYASAFLLFSNARMPARLQNKLLAVPEVLLVSPVMILISIQDGDFESVYGIDFDGYNRIGVPFRFYAGSHFASPDDIIIDSVQAKERGLHVGDTCQILGHSFRVCGVVEPGKGSRLYIPIETAQRLAGAEGMVTLFFVKCAQASIVNDVVGSIKASLPGYVVRTLKDYYRYFSGENLTGLNVFFQALTLIAVAVSLLVTLLTMYAAILERRRELGILKSLGASRRLITITLLAEALAICIGGLALGLALAFVAQHFNAYAFPSRPIDLSKVWVLKGCLITLISGVLGALYPALRASALDPVAAINSGP